MLDPIRDFLKLESAAGIVLVLAAVLAILVANSPLHATYQAFLDLPVEIRLGPLQIAKPLLLWINDGLMAVFFFLIGLELKRELLEGELSDPRSVVLPAVGALGGMLAPALIYLAIAGGDPTHVRGWAIPAATDIAFALGILVLVGERIPLALKVFLVSIAVFDDLGAIIIIALFYTDDLSLTALTIGLACMVPLAVLNWRHVTRVTPYLLIGLIAWIAVLKSGVHATVAGILVALFIPMRVAQDPQRSPARELEHRLHGTVAFLILPLFAFANAGLSLQGMGLSALTHAVPVGIAAGLFFGKPLGILLLCALAVKLGWAKLPEDVGWSGIAGASVLCGVGFTMSLFIGSLAFGNLVNVAFDERLGIMLGSLASGVIGYLLLRLAYPKP